MKNLAQIRAADALSFAQSSSVKRGKDGGEAIKKIPPMIASNGILSAIAFSVEKKRDDLQRPGYFEIFSAIANHLASEDISIVSCDGDADALLNFLIEADSQTLKLVTAEAMEWLSYARRFVNE